jgi:RND family efflux transporter MFP subunit
MRRIPGIICLLASVILGATVIADETTPPSAVILLQKCSIEYERATPVGSNQNVGLIQECLVRPGDRVQAGQVLGRLFNKDVLAEMELRATALESSEIAIRQRAAALEVEKAKLRRAENLISRKALSLQDYQIQQLEVTNKELELKAAIQGRRMAENELQRSKALAATRDIVSPHEGIVVEIYKNVGEAITLSPIFRVVKVDRMRVTGYLNVSDAWHVRPGQVVRVMPELEGDDLPIEREVFDGRVTFVDSEIDPKTRTCRIIAEVDQRDPPGTNAATADHLPGQSAGAAAQPRQASIPSGEGPTGRGRSGGG